MIRMMKPLYDTWKTVVMDSVFCVLKGLVGMLVHGVYEMMATKKKRYSPKYCKLDAIDACFQDNEVGGFNAVCGDIYEHKYKI